MPINRRELVAGAVGVAALTAGTAAAQPRKADAGTSTPPASAHRVQPLPFKPSRLKGLSERLIRSHHENNYAGAVKNLNKVEEELARVGKDTPGFVVGALKERELTFFNSMVLHEHYFGNLGGDGKAAGPVQALLARAHGSFGAWEEHFRATAASLGGGSGWVILDFNLHTGQPRTFWSGNHTQTSAFSRPLLVLDMYEHSYHLDFGAAAARYIDAFFQNIAWDVVNRRLEGAQKMAALLRG